MPDAPQHGQIWSADMNPVRGHEQAGKRPVLVISHNRFNASAAELVVVLPLTSRSRGVGLRVASVVMCDHIRSVSRQRLTKYLGTVCVSTMQSIEEVLLKLMDIEPRTE